MGEIETTAPTVRRVPALRVTPAGSSCSFPSERSRRTSASSLRSTSRSSSARRSAPTASTRLMSSPIGAAFGGHYRQITRPFDGAFTRADLEHVLVKITEREHGLRLA